MKKLSGFMGSLVVGLLLLVPNLTAQDIRGAGSNLKTFQAYIDRDADPNTGLDVLLNDGSTTAFGVEILLTVTVQAGPSPMVVMVEAQDWDGNTGFNPPYFTDASGWPVGTNNGTSASDVVEAYMPLDRLGVTQNINLFVQSGDPASAFDIIDPAPFMFGVPIPTLGEWMLIFYIGLFFIAALWFLRHQKRSKSKGLLALFAATMLFGATCNILLDGQIGDWTDPALVNDPLNDTGDDAVDILAFFVCYDHQNLFVRFDVEELENQPPIPDDQMVSLLEDTPTVISLTATDPNGQPLLFTIDSGPSNGATGAVTSTGFETADVTYTPNADFNGVDSFTFLVDDQNGGTAIGTVDLTIDPVNDIPSFTAGPQVSVSKDTGPQVFNAWATDISAGPTNESGQNLTFTVNVTSNPGVFSVPPAIDATTGNLTFTPDADNNGTASLEIQLMDDGGTANGGVDTSAVQMVDIVIGAVNDAPTFSAGVDQTDLEDDGAILVNGWATAMSPGPPDEAGQMLTFNAVVTSDPGSVFSVPPAVDVTTGDLSYTLAADAFGVATVDITLMDDGGTANGGVDTSTVHTLIITVDEVNDVPSFANTGNVNVFKGGSTETIPAWASMISAGPTNESGQVLTFNVAVTNDPDSVLGSTPTVDPATGNLSFDTTADNNGTATVSITLMDDGGTANGGVDTSAAAVIDIVVGAVNDAPSFTAGADQTHNEDDGAINILGWATNISPGPPDEAGQNLTFNLVINSDPGGIFALAPEIDEATGELSYVLATDAFGVATVSITLMDDGGTANGGVDTSPPHILTVTVNEVNDAPVFINAGNVNVFKGGGTETVPAWATALSRGPANESGQSFTGFTVMVTSDPNNVLGSVPTVDTGTGNLSFDTTADNNGTATISVTLMDDGGTANGGVDTSAAAVIDIIVGSVNDAPSFTAGANQTHNEDDGAINIMPWATAISAGPPDESGQMLTFNAMVTSDPGSIFSVAPSVDAATGNLTYTLAADAFGVATVDITLMDDGGTANGGVDTSTVHTLTITVNEVNDAPSFTNAGNITAIADGNTDTTMSWATALSLGPPNESGQSFTGFSVMVTSDPSSVLGTTPTIDVGTGNLSFDTVMGNTGDATISVTLMDDGGTANGGVDTSAAAVITITVNPPNSPPVANDDTFHTAAHTLLEVGTSTAAPGHEIAGSVLTSGTPDSDPDAGTMLIVTGTSNLTPGAVLNMNADGTFTLLPPPSTTTGTVTFDYTISDQHPTLPLTDTGTVTINLHDPIWYVKNDHGGPSQGTSENPFQTLAEAEAAAGANHKIFVFTGDGTVTGQNAGITLLDGQSLIGERVDLVLDINGTMSTIVTGSGMAASAPNLGNAMGDVVTLGDDNVVRGLTLLPTASAGVVGVGVIPMKQARETWSKASLKYLDRLGQGKRAGGTTLVSEVIINPAGGSDGLVLLGQEGDFTFTNSEINGLPGNSGIGLNLDNCDATFTFVDLNIRSVATGIQINANTNPTDFTDTDITNCTANAVELIFQNNASFDMASSISQTSLGQAVSVLGGSGTLSFNGPITVNDVTAGNAITLNGANANPTINFGALTLDVASGTHAIEISNMGATSDINFNGLLDINDAGSDGLNLDDVNGTVDITNAASDIASAGGNGVFINAGAPTVTYNGTLTDNNLSVFLRNITGGSTNFNGLISQAGGIVGYRVSSSAGTHSVLNANLGTMANRVSEDGIRIVTSSGTFNFTNFNIFATEVGMDIFSGSPTVNILPASTTASINSIGQGLTHTLGGTLTGAFTNIVADTTGTLFDAIELTSPAAGTITFMDLDLDTTGGGGIRSTSNYNLTFTPASTSTINTTTGPGLFMANVANAGQIDSITVTAGSNSAVNMLGTSGSLEFGLLNLTNAAIQPCFNVFNAGTLSVTDNTSSISATGGTAMAMSNVVIGANNMAFATISCTDPGGTNEGIDLDGVSGGTLTVGNAILDTVTNGGIGIDIATSTATFNFNGADIDTATDKGIDLTGNPGGTFNFANMDIDTTSGVGFEASGGGTISATGANRIDTTTGRGIHIDGTTISAANFNMVSINTNGAINGIRLNNTGALGGLSVTGTGTNDSGGNIQNSTADGIFLNSTTNFSINNMQVNNSTSSHINATGVNGMSVTGVDFSTSGSHGINGSGITALALNDCTLDLSGNAANEHGLSITNLLGVSNIINTDFTQSATIHAFIQNTSATAAPPASPSDIITFDDCSFSMPVIGTFGDNISVEAGNNSNMRLILDDTSGQNTFVGGQDGVQAVTATGGTLDVRINNIDVQTTTGVGTNIGGFNASNLTYNVSNISTLNTGSIGINVTSIGGAIMSGFIDTNIVNGSDAGVGIQTVVEGNGSNTITINNNTVTNIDFDHGIRVIARGGSGSINATITGNDIDLSGGMAPLEGIGIEAGATNTDTNTICLNMSGNTSVSNGIEGYFLRRRDMATFNLQGIAQMNPTNPQVVTWVNATNTGTVFISGMGFTQAPANCATP